MFVIAVCNVYVYEGFFFEMFVGDINFYTFFNMVVIVVW